MLHAKLAVICCDGFRRQILPFSEIDHVSYEDPQDLALHQQEVFPARESRYVQYVLPLADVLARAQTLRQEVRDHATVTASNAAEIEVGRCISVISETCHYSALGLHHF